MKVHFQSLLKLRPMLVGLALFSLMWVVMKEVDVRQRYLYDPSYFGSHVTPPLYAGQIFSSSLLVIASLALLLKRTWSHRLAIILSGLVLFEDLFRDFWLLARFAEVPRFSYQHFSLWWPNLSEGHLLRIILSGAILSCSIAFLVRAARNRRDRAMSKPDRPPASLSCES
jgi:hypothetical protein